ncbi:hypothetical protein KIPE111705_09610 [Kibdelosporangium persicum]|uniref:hypothetical protein n=1 Tax=Kibdelosporangium persicum TaxID=2698649 RepID=UPI001567C5FF|nr:hypothetical protein [Kibdelosporangium persicum]
MSTSVELIAAVPVSIATVLLALRYGPFALVTLLAGVVAALTKQSGRGDRALAVLRLLHRSQPRSACKGCRRCTGQM